MNVFGRFRNAFTGIQERDMAAVRGRPDERRFEEEMHVSDVFN